MRGSNFTPAHQRRAAAIRATGFTAEFHQAGGRAAGALAASRPGYLQALARAGAAVTRDRYGQAYLMERMADKKRSRPARGAERRVLALLARWGLVEGDHYVRSAIVTVPGADGLRHSYELDVALRLGCRDIEIDSRLHTLPGRADHDARRDADLAAAGWTVLRLDAATCAAADRLRVTVLRWLVATGGLPGDAD